MYDESGRFQSSERVCNRSAIICFKNFLSKIFLISFLGTSLEANVYSEQNENIFTPKISKYQYYTRVHVYKHVGG